MAVTLADRLHSGNDPKTDEPTKNYAWFCSNNIRNPLYKSTKHTQRINTFICVNIKKQTQEDRSLKGQSIAPGLRETRQRSDKLLTTLRFVKLRAKDRVRFSQQEPSLNHLRTPWEQEWNFSHQSSSFSVSPRTYICKQVESYRVFLVSSWCDSLAAQYRPIYGPQNEQAQFDTNDLYFVLYTRHYKRSA